MKESFSKSSIFPPVPLFDPALDELSNPPLLEPALEVLSPAFEWAIRDLSNYGILIDLSDCSPSSLIVYLLSNYEWERNTISQV